MRDILCPVIKSTYNQQRPVIKIILSVPTESLSVSVQLTNVTYDRIYLHLCVSSHLKCNYVIPTSIFCKFSMGYLWVSKLSI